MIGNQDRREQRDPRLVYPEVQAPSEDHFEAIRRGPQLYDEVPVSDRSSTVSGRPIQDDSVIYISDEEEESDLFADRLAAEKVSLGKW